MNDTPHTHEVKIERKHQFLEWSRAGNLVVIYGDTRRKVPRSWDRVPNAFTIRRAVRKTIRHHDRGSQQLTRTQRKYLRVEAIAKSMQPATADRWGSEK